MAKRKRAASRNGTKAMCNICGVSCRQGTSLKRHIKRMHDVDYDSYKKCFYGDVRTTLADTWDDSVETSNGQTVVYHVLVRRFIV